MNNILFDIFDQVMMEDYNQNGSGPILINDTNLDRYIEYAMAMTRLAYRIFHSASTGAEADANKAKMQQFVADHDVKGLTDYMEKDTFSEADERMWREKYWRAGLVKGTSSDLEKVYTSIDLMNKLATRAYNILVPTFTLPKPTYEEDPAMKGQEYNLAKDLSDKMQGLVGLIKTDIIGTALGGGILQPSHIVIASVIDDTPYMVKPRGMTLGMHLTLNDGHPLYYQPTYPIHHYRWFVIVNAFLKAFKDHKKEAMENGKVDSMAFYNQVFKGYVYGRGTQSVYPTRPTQKMVDSAVGALQGL